VTSSETGPGTLEAHDVPPPDPELLETSLGHLDDGDWLAGTLKPLGARHAGWGVTPPMYDAVAECLIAAMTELGGDAWTEEMTDAWVQALTAVAGLMLTGAAEVEVEAAS